MNLVIKLVVTGILELKNEILVTNMQGHSKAVQFFCCLFFIITYRLIGQ